MLLFDFTSVAEPFSFKLCPCTTNFYELTFDLLIIIQSKMSRAVLHVQAPKNAFDFPLTSASTPRYKNQRSQYILSELVVCLFKPDSLSTTGVCGNWT